MKEEAIFFLDMREKDPNFQKTHCFSIIIVDLNGEYTIYTLHLWFKLTRYVITLQTVLFLLHALDFKGLEIKLK